MVVISASICNKAGKILVARQFVGINRLKLEEYVANFPKLIESGKQCTHVETDAIRYVYVPIEKLFLVLITTKGSNIIEDLEVLKQLNQVVVQACSQNLEEANVLQKAFDLILTFDDVITQGYRESVSMPQLEAFLEMDSTDEKIHRKQQIIREAEAREQSKRVQKELQRKAFEMRHSGAQGDKMKSISSSDFAPKQEPIQQQPGMATQSSSSAMFGQTETQVQELGGRSGQSDRPKKGMQLGRGAGAKKMPSNVQFE